MSRTCGDRHGKACHVILGKLFPLFPSIPPRLSVIMRASVMKTKRLIKNRTLTPVHLPSTATYIIHANSVAGITNMDKGKKQETGGKTGPKHAMWPVLHQPLVSLSPPDSFNLRG